MRVKIEEQIWGDAGSAVSIRNAASAVRTMHCVVMGQSFSIVLLWVIKSCFRGGLLLLLLVEGGVLSTVYRDGSGIED